MRRPLFAANWKMNKSLAEIGPFVGVLHERLKKMASRVGVDYEVVIAPPATHLLPFIEASRQTGIECAAQNCGHVSSGAFTGEVSPQVLKQMGCSWVVLGHSERRHIYLETNPIVLDRFQGALAQGLKPILCVGETLAERKGGKTQAVVEDQLKILQSVKTEGLGVDWAIAYEPVWAIGTGENATPEQAQEVHLFIRNWLKNTLSDSLAEKTRILYGGSVKPDNCGSLRAQADVDGFLVGGASLQAESFADIVETSLKTRS